MSLAPQVLLVLLGLLVLLDLLVPLDLLVQLVPLDPRVPQGPMGPMELGPTPLRLSLFLVRITWSLIALLTRSH